MPLQQRSQLSNRDVNCPLVTGNVGFGKPATAWKGSLIRVEFREKSLPEDVSKKITSVVQSRTEDASPIAVFDFTRGAPYRDLQRNLHDLTWTAGKSELSAPPKQDASGPLYLDGIARLTTKSPASVLVNACRKTNQFSMLVVCRAADPSREVKRIFSLARPNGITDLDIGQNRGDLVFWFRNPISVRKAPLL